MRASPPNLRVTPVRRHDCAAEDARHAVVDAVRATAETLHASLEQMKVVEELRRTLREIRDVNKLDSQ